jgi:hypothetical protein
MKDKYLMLNEFYLQTGLKKHLMVKVFRIITILFTNRSEKTFEGEGFLKYQIKYFCIKNFKK